MSRLFLCSYCSLSPHGWPNWVLITILHPPALLCLSKEAVQHAGRQYTSGCAPSNTERSVVIKILKRSWRVKVGKFRVQIHCLITRAHLCPLQWTITFPGCNSRWLKWNRQTAMWLFFKTKLHIPFLLLLHPTAPYRPWVIQLLPSLHRFHIPSFSLHMLHFSPLFGCSLEWPSTVGCGFLHTDPTAD